MLIKNEVMILWSVHRYIYWLLGIPDVTANNSSFRQNGDVSKELVEHQLSKISLSGISLVRYDIIYEIIETDEEWMKKVLL